MGNCDDISACVLIFIMFVSICGVIITLLVFAGWCGGTCSGLSMVTEVSRISRLRSVVKSVGWVKTFTRLASI